MNALVYHGPGKKNLVDRPKPALQDVTDAIIRISKTTICGTDLHILKGHVPTVAEGRVLGHEGIGFIEELGSAVSGYKVGDLVLISCITSCAKCDYCRRGMYSHCREGGWILGNTIDGTQAEYVRIPHASNSLHPIPVGADVESMVMLSDILPTGYECGVLNGCVKPGDTVAIVGAGPIGLAALLTAQFYAPASIFMIDPDDHRLAVAKHLGATALVNGTSASAVEKVLAITQGQGVDVVIEAVGMPVTFDICQSIVAAGGHIANVGVHGESVVLRLQELWARNITITTRLVDTVTTPQLLKAVMAGHLMLGGLITHRFPLSEILRAYDTFGNAAREQALKIVISNN